MEKSNPTDNDMSYQIVSQLISGKFGKFGGFFLNIIKVTYGLKSLGTDSTPGLNRVN